MSLTQIAFAVAAFPAAASTALAAQLVAYVRNRTDGRVRKSLLTSLTLIMVATAACFVAAMIDAFDLLPFPRVAIFVIATAALASSLWILARFLLVRCGGDDE